MICTSSRENRSWWVALALLAVAGCQPGGVGDPCTPEAEYQTEFGGFDLREVYVESASFQCETRVCLINHFQGRVSCPYGQTEEDLALPGDAPTRCRLPAADGSDPSDSVSLPVEPWNTARTPSQTVYCSCRCDGPDPGAQYCECPNGYNCEPLVPPMGSSSQQLVGSYCIKKGTEFEETQVTAVDCRAVPDHPSCPQPIPEGI